MRREIAFISARQIAQVISAALVVRSSSLLVIEMWARGFLLQLFKLHNFYRHRRLRNGSSQNCVNNLRTSFRMKMCKIFKFYGLWEIFAFLRDFYDFSTLQASQATTIAIWEMKMDDFWHMCKWKTTASVNKRWIAEFLSLLRAHLLPRDNEWTLKFGEKGFLMLIARHHHKKSSAKSILRAQGVV